MFFHHCADTTDQPPATNGHEYRVGIGQVLDDLDTAGTLPGDHFRIVVRRQIEHVFLCGDGALELARRNPDREVVFFALGFETTMPSTALTVLQAEAEGIRNFSLFCNHITIIPTMKAILDSPDMQIDGFLGPGHVSTVIGTDPYEFIASHYGRPLVVAGFEPLDVLQSIWMVLKQIAEGRAEKGAGPGRRAYPPASKRHQLRRRDRWTPTAC